MTAAVLAGLLSTCAPNVDARTMAAVVAVESGGRPWAVHDNTTGRSYFPDSLAGAGAIAAELAGDSLDVGLAQLNSGNFARFGVDASAALDPCTNLRLGASVLSDDYQREYQRTAGATEEERRQVALRRALSAYNSGSSTAAPTYAALVVAATSAALVRETTALADGARDSGATVRVAHAAAPQMAFSAFAGATSRIFGSAFAGGGR